jgi:hypothetical protein|tara:strand:- start:1632 stop:1931 length:300 start_codon:yes stop_codon:yes gene_type:complete
MKLSQIISEITFRTFEAMIKVTFGDEGPSKYDDAIRALPGVTTVTLASQDQESLVATYKVKLISQKEGTEAYEAFKKNAMTKYSNIVSMEIGTETIEEK